MVLHIVERHAGLDTILITLDDIKGIVGDEHLGVAGSKLVHHMLR